MKSHERLIARRNGGSRRAVSVEEQGGRMGGFTFRIGMKFPETRRLITETDQILLHEDEYEVIWLGASGAISEAAWVSLFGTSYASEEAARSAGEHWRSTLSRSLAALSIGADFGDRAGGGGISEELRAQIKEISGLDAYYAKHGLMVYPDTDSAVFLRLEATGVARPSDEVYARAMGLASSSPLSERERVAFDLFSASQFVAHIPDARLIMLVSALEALVDQGSRSPEAVAHLRELEAITKAATELENGDRESILQALQMMRRESVGRAGTKLMAPFADRNYGGMPAPRFFSKCYSVRSALVHGHQKRPIEQDVRETGAHLENLVGHLIAGRDIVDVILGALPTA